MDTMMFFSIKIFMICSCFLRSSHLTTERAIGERDYPPQYVIINKKAQLVFYQIVVTPITTQEGRTMTSDEASSVAIPIEKVERTVDVRGIATHMFEAGS